MIIPCTQYVSSMLKLFAICLKKKEVIDLPLLCPFPGNLLRSKGKEPLLPFGKSETFCKRTIVHAFADQCIKRIWTTKHFADFFPISCRTPTSQQSCLLLFIEFHWLNNITPNLLRYNTIKKPTWELYLTSSSSCLSCGEARKSRRNVAVGHALVSPTGERCAMMAESSTGSKKFLSCFSLCFLVFRNFVAEWNTYTVLL